MQVLSHGFEEGPHLKTFGDRKFLTEVCNVFENFLQKGKFQAIDVKKILDLSFQNPKVGKKNHCHVLTLDDQ